MCVVAVLMYIMAVVSYIMAVLTGMVAAAELYFLSAALVVGLCLYMYCRVLQRMPLYLYYLKSAEGPAGARWLLPEEYPRSAGDPNSSVFVDTTSDCELPKPESPSNGDYNKPPMEGLQVKGGAVLCLHRF